jgi:tellurite resistance protein TerA
MIDFVLKEKGEKKYISVDQLTVTLSWLGAVDLDLVAFYRTKSGDMGGVFSENYMGGSLGNLQQFPYMQLSGDALESEGNQRSEEILKVSHLNEIDQLYILALNHTHALTKQSTAFDQYDVQVKVNTHKESFMVPLSPYTQGVVALICRIDNNNAITGPQLINEGRLMQLDQFYQEIPGAHTLQVAQKLILKTKGSFATLQRSDSDAPIHASLNWTTPVDLDLHCFYLEKGSLKSSTGFWSSLFRSTPTVQQIYYRNRGFLDTKPFIKLDEDEGVGDVGGDNQENIEIARVDHLDVIMFVANIFNKPDAQFASYDGCVRVKCAGQEIEVPLTSTKSGAWGWITLIDCRTTDLKVINIDQVHSKYPSANDFYALIQQNLVSS